MTNKPKIEETSGLREKIDQILYDFSYDVDSDHGDMLLTYGIKKYSTQLLDLISQERLKEKKELLERVEKEVIGEDEYEGLTGEPIQGFRNRIRNVLKEEQRQRLEQLKGEK